MKKCILITSILLLVLSFGCENEMYDFSNQDDLSSNQMTRGIDQEKLNLGLIMLDYLDVIDGDFIFKMTKEEAKTLGISERDYQLMISEVESNNRFNDEYGIVVDNNFIEEAIKMRDSIGFDFDNYLLNNNRLKVSSEGGGPKPIVSGTHRFSSNFTEVGITVPAGYSKIEVTMASQSIIGSCAAQLLKNNNIVASNGSGTWIAGSVRVNLVPPTSGDYTLRIIVSSVDGGWYSYIIS